MDEYKTPRPTRLNRFDDMPDLPHPRRATTKSVELPPTPSNNSNVMRRSKSRNKMILMGIVGFFIVSISTTGWFYLHNSTSPVPKNIVKAVEFPIYYPDQKKLPVGYTLDIDSFKLPLKNGVAYTVSYDNDKKIVFSVQPKPADTEIAAFNSGYIPLRIDFQTALGQGEIGVYKSQTLVSLPVTNGSWVVATAPADINQDQLKQVMSSLRRN